MEAEGRAEVAVVAEVDSDWARRELMLAWSAWTLNFQKGSNSTSGTRLGASGGLINDVTCMRWLGGPTSSAWAKPSDRLREREEVVAGWSLVMALNGRADDVTRAAKALARELHACGQARSIILPKVMLLAPNQFPQAPVVLKGLDNVGLGQRWLVGAGFRPLDDLVFPPIGAASARDSRARGLVDSLPVWASPSSCTGSVWRSVWRVYSFSTGGVATRTGASAALLDGCRSAFERHELELACITPLEDPFGGLDMIGTGAPTSLADAERVTRALHHADRMADGLGYSVVEPSAELAVGAWAHVAGARP